MNDELMVSIDCITYNHEKYIAQAIEGFLMQKTTFKYEILIHDDASTDGTAQIIKKYEKLYPNIIKPIYQSENKYSKNNFLPSTYQFSRAKGKYIAICEGDDYWTDPYKLQKQVDYMENNPECSLCFHNAEVVDGKTGDKTGKLHIPWAPQNKRYYYKKNYRYEAGELALLDFIPTASLIFPMIYLTDLLKNPPTLVTNSIVGDAPLRLLLASFGYAYYFDEVMSIYRVNVEGSSTNRAIIANQNLDYYVFRLKKHIEIIDRFNDYTHYKFNEELDEARKVWEVEILKAQGKTIELKTQRYKNFYKKFPQKERMKIYLSLYYPKIYERIVRVKNIIKTTL